MRFRDLVAAVLAIAVVGIVGYGVWNWAGATTQEATQPPPNPAEATASRYLDAWAAGEHVRMRELVRDPPEDFVARHAQLRRGLEVSGVSLRAGRVVEEVDGRVRFPVTVSLDVPYAEDPITWQTELSLVRDRGEWGIEWSLDTIHPELRETWEFALETEDIERQEILARDGTVLAGETEIVTFGFEPSAVSDVDAVIEAFAAAIPGSEATAARELGRTGLTDGWFYPVATLPAPEAGDVADELLQVAGVLRKSESGRRLYDTGFAQHVVGVFAEATAEQLEEIDGGEPGLEIGQYGLEKELEEQLVGSDLVRAGLRETDAATGTPLRVVIAETQQDPAAPVTTTLDVDVQQAIENALNGVDERVGFVAVDTADGAILGSASRPLSAYNRAFEARYPPGSTFKIVTAEALLATGLSPDDPVDCPARATVGGLVVSNAGDAGHGTIPFRDAFARSCNTTFARLGADLEVEELLATAGRFGFGVDPDLPLAAFGGSFPRPADTAERGAAAFGQARVEASALHMATVVAAATTGVWHAPRLLLDGDSGSRELTAGTDGALRDLLRAVITRGTGTTAAVDDLDIVGKTGTAQAAGGVEHAWFVGAYDGVGFAIVVEEGGSGGDVAAPIGGRFVRELEHLRRADPDGDESDDDGNDGDGDEEGDGADGGGPDDRDSSGSADAG